MLHIFLMKNKALNTFDAISNTITPDTRYAQILLEECSRRLNRDRVLSVLKSQKIQPVSYEILQPEFPAIILLRLTADNLGAVILKLTENGFTRLKAINPLAGGAPL